MNTRASMPYNLTLGLIGPGHPPRITVDLAGVLATSTWENDLFGQLSTNNRRTVIAKAGAKYAFNDELHLARLHPLGPADLSCSTTTSPTRSAAVCRLGLAAA